MSESNKCLKCLEFLNAKDEFEEAGLHAGCFKSWFRLDKNEPFSGFVRRQAGSLDPDVAVLDDNWTSSFFHGRFKKYSATLAGESYIFKVKEDVAPELPDNEYLCNQIAHSLGLPVPAFYILKFAGTRTFVTKNFVQAGEVANLVHIYHYRKPKVDFCCEDLLQIILEQTGRLADAETFIRTCLFDALIGNHDRHGRNLGFLVTAKSTRLAPIYDNTSALGLEHGDILKADWDPKSKIATMKSKEPTAKDYIEEFLRLGYKQTVASFKASLDLTKVLALIDRSFCSELMKDAMKRLISKRYREVQDAAKS